MTKKKAETLLNERRLSVRRRIGTVFGEKLANEGGLSDSERRRFVPAVAEAMANAPQLSDRERRRIAHTLPPLRNGVDLADVLATIELERELYWRNANNEGRNAPWLWPKLCSGTWRDFHNVANCALNLLNAIDSLGVDGQNKLEALLQRDHIRGTTYLSLVECENHIARIGCAANTFRPRGRPSEFALYIFAVELAFVYETVTGARPRRRYNDCKQYEDGAEQLPFFAACMAAAGVAKYPTRIIRKALESYLSLRKVGQRKLDLGIEAAEKRQ